MNAPNIDTAFYNPIAEIIEAQGLSLRLWRYGHTDATTRILLLHGFLDGGRSFDLVAHEMFMRHNDVVLYALDWRGHGESSWVGAGGSYHLLDHAKDLAIVLQELTKERALDVLVAHSMGANVVIQVLGSLTFPIRALMLLDELGGVGEEGVAQIQNLQAVLKSILVPKKHFASCEHWNDVMQKMQQNHPSLTSQAHEVLGRTVFLQDKNGRYEPRLDPRLRGPVPMRYPENTWIQLLKNITIPTRVLQAQEGFLVQHEGCENRVKALPHGELITIPGGHMMHVGQPEKLATIIVEMIRSSSD